MTPPFRKPALENGGVLRSVPGMASSLAADLRAEAGKSDGLEQPLSEYGDKFPGGRYEGFLAFTHDVLGVKLWSKQKQIAKALLEGKKGRVAVRSGHSVGKTMLTACLCEYHFSCLGLPFLTTAPGRDAMKDLLWKQIKTNRQNALRQLPGEVLDGGEIKVQGRDDWWGKGFATNKAERAQGKHAVGLLCVADEAAGIQGFIWDALESSMASEGVSMLIIGNPNHEQGQFYQAFHEHCDLWDTFHISSLDSPNITEDEDPIPGLATPKWLEAQKIRYKDEPDKYRCRILGEWPVSDATTKCLPMDWIIEAQQLWMELAEEEPYYEEEPKIHSAFLDVAGWGKDKSALTYLRGQRFHIQMESDDKSDEGLMRLAEAVDEWICQLDPYQKPHHIAVDCDAVGAGTFSRLRQLRTKHLEQWGRCKLVKFHWGWQSTKPQEYTLIIDEVHWALREAIDPSKPREDRLAIPPGNRVAKQLNLRKYTEDNRERKKVESKQSLHDRNAPSPDIGDSIVGNMHKPRMSSVRKVA